MTNKIEQKDGGAGGHAGSAGDQKTTRRLRRIADIIHDLRLLGHVDARARETRDQPIMGVEGGGSAEVLLHPGDGIVTHTDRLAHDHADKSTERTQPRAETE